MPTTILGLIIETGENDNGQTILPCCIGEISKMYWIYDLSHYMRKVVVGCPGVLVKGPGR